MEVSVDRRYAAVLACAVLAMGGCPRAGAAPGANGDSGTAQPGQDGGLFAITPADCIFGSPCPAGQVCVDVGLQPLLGTAACGTCRPQGDSGYCGGCPAQKWGCVTVPPGCQIGQLCSCSPYFTSASQPMPAFHQPYQPSPPCFNCKTYPTFYDGGSYMGCDWYTSKP